MSTAIHLRRYESGDFAQVYELHVRALVEVGAYLGAGPWDDDLRHIAAVYSRDAASSWWASTGSIPRASSPWGRFARQTRRAPRSSACA
jgi:hypothetical protein